MVAEVIDLAAARLAMVAALRSAVAQQIAEDPAEVTVTRVERVPAGGGFEERRSTLGPYRVRLYTSGSRSSRVDTATAGSRYADPVWAVLAPWDADLRAGAHVEDTIEAPGLGKFKVLAVYPRRVGGEVVGVLASLEKVN